MAQKFDSKKTVSMEELACSNSMQIEVLIRLLVKQGIISEAAIKEEYEQLLQEAGKEAWYDVN